MVDVLVDVKISLTFLNETTPSQRRSTHSNNHSNRASQRSGGRNQKNPVGRTQSQEVSEMAENQSYSPFSAILNIVGVTANPPLSAAG